MIGFFKEAGREGKGEGDRLAGVYRPVFQGVLASADFVRIGYQGRLFMAVGFGGALALGQR